MCELTASACEIFLAIINIGIGSISQVLIWGFVDDFGFWAGFSEA
jgi:hypothetical protein